MEQLEVVAGAINHDTLVGHEVVTAELRRVRLTAEAR
jgi:hypothetical protein